MKTLRLSVLAGFLFGHVLAGLCPAATIVWTNTSGGSWSTPQNWSPNRVPAASDEAVVTNAGTYRITLDTNATVASFILGGDGGQQTLTNSSKTLTLNGASLVDTNGILGLGGGVLSGSGPLAVNGGFWWTGGTLSGVGLTMASNATLTVSGTGDKTMIASSLTNAGTVLWTGAGALVGHFNGQNQTNRIVNLGVFEAQNDARLDWTWTAVWANQGFFVENAGVWRKSGATGTSVIEANFANRGTVEVQSGTVQLTGGGTLGGSFNLGAEAAWELAGGSYSLTAEATFGGGGWCRMTGNPTVSSGGADVDRLEMAGGTLGGVNRISGLMNWTGGTLSGGSLTMASNATLTVSGAADKTMITSSLTNAGTVRWTGTGALVGRFPANNQTNRIINLGVFEAQSDAALRRSLAGAYNNALLLFENAGVWRKSGSTGTNLIEATFANRGTVDLSSGILRVTGNYTCSATANLSVRIGGLAPGIEFSQLQISGAAPLNGRLTINAASGFVPGPNDTFRILTSQTRQGEFASVGSEPIAPRIYYNPRYLANGVELAIVEASGQVTGMGYNRTNCQATLRLAGVAGQNYAIEATTDFERWTPLGTNTMPGCTWLDFRDAASTNYPYRFYRVWFVP